MNQQNKQIKLSEAQKIEVIALCKKLLKCAGKQHPIILSNAAYMLIQAAEATHI